MTDQRTASFRPAGETTPRSRAATRAVVMASATSVSARASVGSPRIVRARARRRRPSSSVAPRRPVPAASDARPRASASSDDAPPATDPAHGLALSFALATCVASSAASPVPASAAAAPASTASVPENRVVVAPRDAAAEYVHLDSEGAYRGIDITVEPDELDADPGDSLAAPDPSTSASGSPADLAPPASSVPELVAAAARAFVKPLLSELGAAVLGFGVGAVASGFFMGWQQSKKGRRADRASNRQALADLSTLDESEIQALVGELPAWLAFRDVERAGWLNKVLAAAWPYLDQATSDVIVAALDPILQATRPSFLTTLSFERFSFGGVPARIEGVKVYETTGDGSVEIDLQVFWAGDPDVVLGVRAAQDALSVPVSLTEFECTFTLRLIFAPLLGVFPCFGALTIALMDEPQLDFDLRVVGGDVTLVPGLKDPLRAYIKALIASWMVWPRCITVAIPGTGYTLPSDDEREKPTTGLLQIQVVNHDGGAVNPGEVGLQVRWPVADLLLTDGQAEVRVKALPGGGVLSSKEITLPVEDPRAQLLCVRWYTRAVVDEDTGVVIAPERLDGEASVVLDELMRQAKRRDAEADEADATRPELGSGSGATSSSSPSASTIVDVPATSWGPVPIAAELEPPIGADIKSIGWGKDGAERRGALGAAGGLGARAARGIGGLWGKSASSVVSGYRAAREKGLGGIRGGVVDGWREESARRAERDRKRDAASASTKATHAGESADSTTRRLEPEPEPRLVRLRVRYQSLNDALLADASADVDDSLGANRSSEVGAKRSSEVGAKRSSSANSASSASSAPRERAMVDGMFVSGEFGDSSRRDRDGSFATGRDRSFASVDVSATFDEELSHMQATLEEKDREIASMRADRARLERELEDAAAERESSRAKRRAERDAAARAAADAAADADAAAKHPHLAPSAVSDSGSLRLEALKAATRRTLGAVKAARALPDSERASLEATLVAAETLVEKASAVVRESAAAERSEETARAEAEAEAELAALKAAVAAAREADDRADVEEEGAIADEEEGATREKFPYF